ncbi:MAG: F0F1 ATP synthase subunit delta [Pseudomonadota bacterium]
MISGVAGRYARSLFELADEAKSIDAVSSELASLKKALNDSRDLKAFVESPLLSAGEQISALKQILDKAGVKDLTAKFVQLLAQNRRLNLLSETISGFEKLVAQSKGLTGAEVTSAEPLSENQLGAIKAALKESTGKDVEIETRVDQSLIGGLVVKLGSRMLDTSLKTKLSSMKTALKGIA